MAAGIECEHEGNLPVTPELVLKKIDSVEKHFRWNGKNNIPKSHFIKSPPSPSHVRIHATIPPVLTGHLNP
jgi:hypothetical protein